MDITGLEVFGGDLGGGGGADSGSEAIVEIKSMLERLLLRENSCDNRREGFRTSEGGVKTGDGGCGLASSCCRALLFTLELLDHILFTCAFRLEEAFLKDLNAFWKGSLIDLERWVVLTAEGSGMPSLRLTLTTSTISSGSSLEPPSFL